MPREGQNLERLLIEQGLSPAWLARKLGKSKQTVYNWIEGMRPQKAEEVWPVVATLLGVQERALHEDLPESPAPKIVGDPQFPVAFEPLSIKLVSPVPCGDWVAPEETEDLIEVDAKFVLPNRFAAKVIGDSCYPVLRQGDIAIFHADPNPSYGLIVLARRKEDHAVTVKHLKYDEQRHRPILESINPVYGSPDDGDGWSVIAYLVGIMRDENGIEQSFYARRGIRP